MASASPLDKVASRALIIHENKLLVVKLKPEHDFYCLPGGSLERWETMEECFEREITEELGITPIIRKLLFINQGLIHKWDIHMLEFFYLVDNAQDFLNIDISQASHSFEVHEMKRVTIEEDFNQLAPYFLMSELKKIDRNNLETYQTKVIVSE